MNSVPIPSPLPPAAPSPSDSIEEALRDLWPDEWRRLRAQELAALGKQIEPLFQLALAWRLDMPPSEHEHPRVDHVFLVIDDTFPFSDLRVCAPQAGGQLAERWPHVEEFGMLCLARRPLDLPIRDRIRLAVADAAEVLGMDESTRKREFQREALSYWQRESSQIVPWRTLFPPAGVSRIVFYERHNGTLVFAETAAQLSSWLRHSGVIDPPSPSSAWFAMLDEALVPAQYPATGRDLLDLVGRGNIAPLLDPPDYFPVLLGMPTETGVVFGGVHLYCPPKKEMWKGFRRGKQLPETRIVCCYAGRRVDRIQILRADPSWVHGRDHDPAASRLAEKTVALIGCGALGGELARLLAQSGVGSFVLVDHDKLAPENTSRHLLGAADTGGNKAAATARRLERDFPHIREACPFGRRFEQLSDDQLAKIDAADLVITAGLFLPSDIRFNDRRKRADTKQPWLVAWTEELACAGHAALLVGTADLMNLFDHSGKPKRAMTSGWPPSVGTITEAGCGNAFQPYGATDMLSTIGLAARLAIDSLLGRCASSTYRVWLGDRARVTDAGATLSHEFDISMTERTIPWPL